MKYRWLRSPRGIIIAPLLLALLVIVACGSAAEPVTQPQDTPKDAVPAATSAPVAAVPAATAVPTAAPKKVEEASAKAQAEAQKADAVGADPDLKPIYGGTLNMAQYANVRQRLIHQSRF